MRSRHCSGVVLAGGASSRFGGKPKGLARIGTERVVDRVITALRLATDEQMLIANDRAIREAVPGLVVRRDVRTERGSLVGLHTALTHSREAALVVAWDMPFVSAALLAELRRLGEARGAAVIPEGARGPEPLCAYYPRSALPVVERQLEAEEMRLSELVAVLPERMILSCAKVERFGPVERLFANINSATDLAALGRLGAAPSLEGINRVELV
jgi:molybdopterin-guanine dinucleotide biosynthesis protein A